MNEQRQQASSMVTSQKGLCPKTTNSDFGLTLSLLRKMLLLNSRWFHFIIRTSTFLIYAIASQGRQQQKTGEWQPHQGAIHGSSTHGKLISGHSHSWLGSPRVEIGMQPCETASDAGVMISTEQACQGKGGKAVSMLPCFCCKGASSLQGC